MIARNRQITCIALLPFVVIAAVASLDALVLCSTPGHETAIEAAQHGLADCGSECVPVASRGIAAGAGSRAVRHGHKACRDVHLKLYQGDLRDLRAHRVQVTLEADTFVIDAPEETLTALDACLPTGRYSLQHLRSVILLV